MSDGKGYEDKHYRVEVKAGPDALSVSKYGGSDWCNIKMVTNGSDNGEVVVRSKEMAEHLLFMLGQMLGK